MGLVWGFWGASAILSVLVRSFPHLSDGAGCWAFAFRGEVPQLRTATVPTSASAVLLAVHALQDIQVVGEVLLGHLDRDYQEGRGSGFGGGTSFVSWCGSLRGRRPGGSWYGRRGRPPIGPECSRPRCTWRNPSSVLLAPAPSCVRGSPAGLPPGPLGRCPDLRYVLQCGQREVPFGHSGGVPLFGRVVLH